MPVIAELRKLHRQANIRHKGTATRVSDEKKKWLTWTEFLTVVDNLKMDYLSELITKEANNSKPIKPPRSKLSIGLTKNNSGYSDAKDEINVDAVKMSINGQKKVAVKLQRYLILAFFSAVPDRQRTIRELSIGTTFLKESNQHYVIKHGPDDYKTGKSYGDRPPLVIPEVLSPFVGTLIWSV